MSDDEECFMGKAFPVEELLKNANIPLDPTQPPADAIQYLKLVQLEASKLDDVVVAKIDESKLKKQTVVYKPEEKPTSSLSPSREWKICQVADFSELRLQFSKLLDKVHQSREFELPKKSEADWSIFCLGSEVSKKLGYCIECVKEIEYHPPLTRYILAMNQVTVERVLEFHIEWLKKIDYSYEQGQWIYALLVRLELPLIPEVCSLLRTLARTCAVKRDELACKEEAGVKNESLIMSLNLLICLVSLYFRQLDLEDI